MRKIKIMRDPNRLDDFYEKLKKMHKTYCPDWRFGQFICNFVAWYMSKYNNDIFYIEDDKICHYIREFIDEMGVKYAE
jgi:hypothetical protein